MEHAESNFMVSLGESLYSSCFLLGQIKCGGDGVPAKTVNEVIMAFNNTSC